VAPVMVTAMMASTMMTRLSRCQGIAPSMPAAPTSTPFGRFGHPVEPDGNVRPATARTRTRPDNGLAAPTTLLARTAQGHLAALAKRIAPAPTMPAAPTPMGLSRRIAPTPARPASTSTGLGRRDGIAPPAMPAPASSRLGRCDRIATPTTSAVAAAPFGTIRGDHLASGGPLFRSHALLRHAPISSSSSSGACF